MNECSFANLIEEVSAVFRGADILTGQGKSDSLADFPDNSLEYW